MIDEGGIKKNEKEIKKWEFLERDRVMDKKDYSREVRRDQSKEENR